MAELAANGVKFSRDDLIATGRSPTGQVVFLESGNTKAGLQHIIDRHLDDFANIGVSEAQIPDVVMGAVTQGKVLGYQGKDQVHPIFEINVNGQAQKIAVTTGSNGFIVGSNPAGSGK